ncbi:hypothetical protein D3C84_270550 [compost metagenome]
MRSHGQEKTGTTGHRRHLVDELALCTSGLHGHHVQLFVTDVALVVHVHDAFGLETGQGVKERQGRTWDLDQFATALVNERGGDQDRLVFATAFTVLAHDVPPFVTVVHGRVGEQETATLDQIDAEQFRELTEYVHDTAG